jgi:hypothetical protein
MEQNKYIPCPECSTGFPIHDAIESCLGKITSNLMNGEKLDMKKEVPEILLRCLFNMQYNLFDRNCIKCFLSAKVTSEDFIRICEENQTPILEEDWKYLEQKNKEGLLPIEVVDNTIRKIKDILDDEYWRLKNYESSYMYQALCELKEMKKYLADSECFSSKEEFYEQKIREISQLMQIQVYSVHYICNIEIFKSPCGSKLYIDCSAQEHAIHTINILPGRKFSYLVEYIKNNILNPKCGEGTYILNPNWGEGTYIFCLSCDCACDYDKNSTEEFLELPLDLIPLSQGRFNLII